MKYPTLQQVDQSSKFQLGRWIRFLRSPGWDHVAAENFETMREDEAFILDCILEKFHRLGGWDPELSKLIG